MKKILAASAALGLLGAGVAAARGQVPAGPNAMAPGAALVQGVAGDLAGRPDSADAPPPDRASVPRPATETASGEETALPRGNPLWNIPLDSLRATRERPIFSESRRPPPPVVAVVEPPRPVAPPPEPEPAEPEPPALTLVGTVVGTEDMIALFIENGGHEVVRLRIGEEGSGWILRSVDSRSTVFEKGNHEVTLSLPAPDAEAGAGMPAPMNAFIPPTFPGRPPAGFPQQGRPRPPVPVKGGFPSAGALRAQPPRPGTTF